ncbi:MAG: RNA polymerase sigma-70 factor [Tannerella sp.]|jgi:RNA polymerase sigma-70 factor (ECF subfamily)|nr:RNA polymerase sigma-70 factor [Tannerella sp.]
MEKRVNTDKMYSEKPLSLSNDVEFKKLFEDFYIPMCVFANKYMDDIELSADIVQDCFLKLWQIKEDFFYLHQVKAFLYTSVRNRCLNEIEHSKVVNEFTQKMLRDGEEGFFHDHVIEEETYRILTEGINKLPKQMKIIMMHALEGLSNSEIAEEMNVSLENVRSLKKIAYKKLRDILKDHYYFLFFMI